MAPGHPLWPAITALDHEVQQHPSSGWLARLRSVYSGAEINDHQRHIFQHAIPADVEVVGYATTIYWLEPGLWRPFQRRVERVLPDDAFPELDARHIQYVVVEERFVHFIGGSLEQLLKRYHGELTGQEEESTGFKQPPTHYYLIRVLPAGQQ